MSCLWSSSKSGSHLGILGALETKKESHRIWNYIYITKHTDDFQVDARFHGKRQREKRERVEFDAGVAALYASNARLELTVEKVDNDRLIPQQMIVPRLEKIQFNFYFPSTKYGNVRNRHADTSEINNNNDNLVWWQCDLVALYNITTLQTQKWEPCQPNKLSSQCFHAGGFPSVTASPTHPKVQKWPHHALDNNGQV